MKLRLAFPPAPPPPSDLGPPTDIALKILAVLAEAERPLKDAAVTRPAGCVYNSHFKSVLSRLKKQGKIVWSAAEGYALPAEDYGGE